MRDFQMLDQAERDDFVVIFADSVAARTPSNGMAVLSDRTYRDGDDFSFPFAVIVHGEITHITNDEARRLRDALSGVLDA